MNGVSAPIKAMLNGKVTDCVENLISDDKQLSGVIKMVDANALLDFNILTDVIPSYLDPSNASRYGYEVMEDDYGAKLYLKLTTKQQVFSSRVSILTPQQMSILTSPLSMHLATQIS